MLFDISMEISQAVYFKEIIKRASKMRISNDRTLTKHF